MASRVPSRSSRRRPQQRRARQTVDAILDAVVRILKREGVGAITTNRIAEVAGVSIGSIYQYFPDKHAIFAALHRRHIEEIDRVVESTLVKHAASSLEGLVRAMVTAMVDIHVSDPELYHLLLAQVRLHGAFLLAISAKAGELRKRRNLDTVVFVVTQMIEALSHGAALRRPPGLSLAEAKEEMVRAVMAYLHAWSK